MKCAIGLAVCFACCSVSAAAEALIPQPARGMVADGYGMLFVFDTDPAAIVAAIRLDRPGGGGTDCVISTDGRRGFVTDLQHRVWVIDLTSTPPQLAAGPNPVAIPGFGHDVALTAAGQFLLVANRQFTQPSVSVIDVPTRTVSSTFDPGLYADSVDVCSDGSVLVASAVAPAGVRRLVIDAAGQLINTGEHLPLAGTFNVYCAPGATSGIAMSFSGQIQSFRLPGLTPVSHRALPAFGAAGAVSKDGTKFYGRSFYGVTAFDFDQATGELGPAAIYSAGTSSTGLFNTPGGEQVALDPADSRLYVPVRHRLGVVDAGTGATLPPLPMPDLLGSGGICFGPRNESGCIVAACDDGNPCTDDVCGDAGCLNVPDDTNACGDPESCGDAGLCSGGACVSGGQVDCNAPCPPGFAWDGDAACLKSYEIDASLLDNLGESCDGTGVDRFNCAGAPYGFHWTDAGGSGVGRVQFVDLKLVNGLNCQPGFSALRFNGVTIDQIDAEVDCSCSPGHTPRQLYPQSENYAKDGVNAISIVPSGSCEGLSAGPLLDGLFARVIVSYARRDPNCATGACNPATDRCDYTVIDCDDGNPCTIDTCDAQGACVYEPAGEGTDCDDGYFCNGYGTCDGNGTCISTPVYCFDDLNPCSLEYCDPDTGCASEPAPVGTPCDDGSSCSVNDRCDGYFSCVGDSGCDDGNPCTFDIGDESNACACQHPVAHSGTPCDDGAACTVNTTCDGVGGVSACTGGQTTCDDGNPCTDDACHAVLGCTHTNNTNPCDDFNACTSGDTCSAGACQRAPVTCDDGNPCTDDACHPVAGCLHANNALPCDDGNVGTENDTCHSGVCTGATCTSSNDPKTRGWYHSLCRSGGHSGDSITDSDAACVAAMPAAFSGISTAAEVCAVLSPSHHGNDPAAKAAKQLMTLALNICKHRVCPSQGLDATCGGAASVAQAFHAVDAVLLDPGHTDEQLAVAECQAGEINNGHALRLDTLIVNRDGAGVRLAWIAPMLDDGTGAPSRYKVWRRPMGSAVPFIEIGTVTDLTFLDTASGTDSAAYQVTAD